MKLLRSGADRLRGLQPRASVAKIPPALAARLGMNSSDLALHVADLERRQGLTRAEIFHRLTAAAYAMAMRRRGRWGGRVGHEAH